MFGVFRMNVNKFGNFIKEPKYFRLCLSFKSLLKGSKHG